MNAVWDRSKASGTTRVVLLAMADWANDDGFCWPSLTQLAKKANATRQGVLNAIQRLTDTKELTRITRGHIADNHDRRPAHIRRQPTNCYQINLVNQVVKSLDQQTREVVKSVDHSKGKLVNGLDHSDRSGSQIFGDQVVKSAGDQVVKSVPASRSVSTNPSVDTSVRTRTSGDRSEKPAADRLIGDRSIRARTDQVLIWFEKEFWPAYPKKHARIRARNTLLKIAPTLETQPVILAALAQQKKQWATWPDAEQERFIPLASSWLNDQRWLDEVTTAIAHGTHYEMTCRHDPACPDLHTCCDLQDAERSGEAEAIEGMRRIATLRRDSRTGARAS